LTEEKLVEARDALDENYNAVWFEYEEEKMYSKRERTLIRGISRNTERCRAMSMTACPDSSPPGDRLQRNRQKKEKLDGF
jgi:hypothetical protein